MKLFIVFVVFSLICIAGYSQDSLKVKDLADSTQLTFSKVYSDVKAGLVGLGSALKVGSEHVYRVLVKQQIVKSVTWLLTMIVFFLILAKGISWCKRCYKDDDIDFDNSPGPWIGAIITAIVGVIGFISSVCYLDVIVTGFVNPEYGAIKDIFEFIK